MKFRATKLVPISALTALAILALPATAFAAAGGGKGFPWGAWIAGILNLLIFLWIIYKFFGSSISEFFKNRRETLIADLEEARKLREEAEARLEEYTARLDALEDERKQLLEEYHEQGEREKKRIIEDAKKQVEKMRADAEVTIEQETKKAIASLERQVVDLAVDMTEKMAQTKLGASEQTALIDNYVGELGQMEGPESERAA